LTSLNIGDFTGAALTKIIGKFGERWVGRGKGGVRRGDGGAGRCEGMVGRGEGVVGRGEGGDGLGESGAGRDEGGVGRVVCDCSEGGVLSLIFFLGLMIFVSVCDWCWLFAWFWLRV